MPKKKEEEVEKAEKKVGAKALQVYTTEGKPLRSHPYTVELHGNRMKEYAEEFAKKTGGVVKAVR